MKDQLFSKAGNRLRLTNLGRIFYSRECHTFHSTLSTAQSCCQLKEVQNVHNPAELISLHLIKI